MKETNTNNKTATEKRSSVQKQIVAIIAIAAAALIVAILFFGVIRPLLPQQEDPVTPPPELLEGEVLGFNNRIQLYEKLDEGQIQRIDIRNDLDSFAVILGEDGKYYMEDYPVSWRNTTLISSLINDVGYALAIERITTDCTDFSAYGLSVADDPASFTVTSTDGTTHTVFVGDLIPTGGGYYCRYRGRDALYVLDYGLEDTVLISMLDYILPQLTYAVDENDQYSITDFQLKKDGELFVHINRLGENEKQENASVSTFKMEYPGNYVPSTQNYESSILSMIPAMQGAAVMAVGTEEKIVQPEVLAEYGIDLLKPAFYLHYVYKDVSNDVYFSAYDPALGCYYAYSAVFNQVVAISATSVSFLEWDFIQYVDRPIIQMWIHEIGELSLQCGDYDETFYLSGKEDTLAAKRASTGDAVDINNLKRLVQVIYSLKLEDYAPYTDETLGDMTVTGDVMTLKVTTRAGKVFEFVFYPYHTRRALFTVNGVGEFYVLRDQLNKVMSDANKLLAGEAIDPYSNR